MCVAAEEQWAETVRGWGEGDPVAGQLGELRQVYEVSSALTQTPACTVAACGGEGREQKH